MGAGVALALFDDNLVDALARHLEVLGETGLAALDERPVVEHVAHGAAESFGALWISFGHHFVSDTLDIRIKRGSCERVTGFGPGCDSDITAHAGQPGRC